MNGALDYCQSRFEQRLRQGRMGVTGSRDIFGTGGKLHGEDGLGYELRSPGADDMNAKEPVAPDIGDKLYHSFRLIHAACPRVRLEWELPDSIFAPGFLDLFFR